MTGRITIRRAITRGQVTTPKSGRSRAISMSPGLQADLKALLALRRPEVIEEAGNLQTLDEALEEVKRRS